MERWVAKILAGVILFVLPLICTMVPIKMSSYFQKRGEEGKLIMGRLMCFGGGVFFSTFLMHMIPEVKNILDHALLVPNNVSYPVAELLMGAGFFLVLMIETLAIKGHNRRISNSALQREMKVTAEGQEYVMVSRGEQQQKEIKVRHVNGNDHNASYEKSDVMQALELEEMEESPSVPAESHHSSRSLVLAIALSLHRIFEGMSVGLKLTVLGVWSMFIAVICHEAIIGFSLGLQFMRNQNTVRRNLVYATICSIIMPIGVAIGSVMVEIGENIAGLDIANGVLQAISTGTFIYVTFFEILHDEFTHGSHDLSKVLSLAFGFSVMAAINAIPEKEDFTEALVNTTSVPTLG